MTSRNAETNTQTKKTNGWIHHNKPLLDPSDASAIQKVIQSGWVAEGNISRLFETEVSKSLGPKFAKVTSSGTSALHLALLALGIQKGDEVILSTYACTALLNAIHYVQAKPVLVDIDENHLGPASAEIRKKITKKTKAIIVHHAFGFPSDISRIKSLGIPVIEDCAQSLGTTIQGKPAGSFGDLTVLSFYATKMMTAGYGGMILTNQKNLHDRVLDLTDFDKRKDYKVRYNYYLSDVSSALGLNQFRKLKSLVARRRAIASQYEEAIRLSPFYSWKGKTGDAPNFYRFPVGCLRPFQELVRYFERQKIQVISPIEPFQLLHRYLKQDKSKFPKAEAIARAVVSVPVYPALSDSEVKRVANALQNYIPAK